MNQDSRFRRGDIVRHLPSNRLGVVLLVERYSATDRPALYELHVDTDQGVEIWELSEANVVTDDETRAEVRRLGLRGLPGSI